jgi:hypothetical protein
MENIKRNVARMIYADCRQHCNESISINAAAIASAVTLPTHLHVLVAYKGYANRFTAFWGWLLGIFTGATRSEKFYRSILLEGELSFTSSSSKKSESSSDQETENQDLDNHRKGKNPTLESKKFSFFENTNYHKVSLTEIPEYKHAEAEDDFSPERINTIDDIRRFFCSWNQSQRTNNFLGMQNFITYSNKICDALENDVKYLIPVEYLRELSLQLSIVLKAAKGNENFQWEKWEIIVEDCIQYFSGCEDSFSAGLAHMSMETQWIVVSSSQSQYLQMDVFAITYHIFSKCMLERVFRTILKELNIKTNEAIEGELLAHNILSQLSINNGLVQRNILHQDLGIGVLTNIGKEIKKRKENSCFSADISDSHGSDAVTFMKGLKEWMEYFSVVHEDAQLAVQIIVVKYLKLITNPTEFISFILLREDELSRYINDDELTNFLIDGGVLDLVNAFLIMQEVDNDEIVKVCAEMKDKSIGKIKEIISEKIDGDTILKKHFSDGMQTTLRRSCVGRKLQLIFQKKENIFSFHWHGFPHARNLIVINYTNINTVFNNKHSNDNDFNDLLNLINQGYDKNILTKYRYGKFYQGIVRGNSLGIDNIRNLLVDDFNIYGKIDCSIINMALTDKCLLNRMDIRDVNQIIELISIPCGVIDIITIRNPKASNSEKESLEKMYMLMCVQIMQEIIHLDDACRGTTTDGYKKHFTEKFVEITSGLFRQLKSTGRNDLIGKFLNVNIMENANRLPHFAKLNLPKQCVNIKEFLKKGAPEDSFVKNVLQELNY